MRLTLLPNILLSEMQGVEREGKSRGIGEEEEGVSSRTTREG
jgi:hypothetical protein